MVTNGDNLEADSLEVIQSLTTALWMRLDESQDPNQIRLRTDLGMGLSIKFACKLTKSMTETSSKIHDPKTYNKAIHDLKNGNRCRKAIGKKLWNLDSHQA